MGLLSLKILPQVLERPENKWTSLRFGIDKYILILYLLVPWLEKSPRLLNYHRYPKNPVEKSPGFLSCPPWIAPGKRSGQVCILSGPLILKMENHILINKFRSLVL